MRVLHIINSLGSGGAENLLSNLLPLMKQKGIDVELLLLTKKNDMYYEVMKNKVKIIVSPIEKTKSYRQVKYIKTIIEKGKYDVVHSHLFPVLYWTSLAAKQIKKDKRPKIIYTEHSTNNRRRKWYFRPMERFIYRGYSKIIAISDGVSHSLSKWIGKKQEEKVITILNGIPLDKFIYAIPYNRKELVEKYEAGDKLILMVGRFSDQKDQKTLIRSLGLLPEKFKLILVGEGKNMDECKTLVDKLKLSHRVSFLGRRTDVDRITKTVDLCVVSSHWEGFGLVAVEAMACGTTVIGSDVAGLFEIIGDKQKVFSPGDAAQLAESILVNVTNNEKNNYSDQIKKYSIDTMCEKYIEVYRTLYDKDEKK